VFEDAPVGIQAAKAAFLGGTSDPYTGQDPGRRGMYAVGVTTTHPASVLWEAGADEVVPNLVGYDVDRLLGRLEARSIR
jgi:beta-phosphoglucomutase-like phosphatase (HAD superfamily)